VTSSNRPDDRTDRRRVAHIVVRTDLEPQLQEVLPECAITTVRGEIHITGRLQDQAQLYAILDHLRSLGATLVSLAVDQ
jgi:hypothetical protein